MDMVDTPPTHTPDNSDTALSQDLLVNSKSEPGLPSFKSLVSLIANMADVFRDIYIFDPRLPPLATEGINSVTFGNPVKLYTNCCWRVH
ncbi:hypothetical protein N0V94_009167 [Neodidymelliopsis sp. IMI 364377]|nr:hypothetical protein N0V94_009167 [Neodidymelliopsis sp. IMI 364377]